MKLFVLTLIRKYEIDGDSFIDLPSSIRKKINKILIILQIYLEYFCDSRSKSASKIKLPQLKLRRFLGDNLDVSPSRIACVNFILNNEDIFVSNQKLNILDIGCGDGEYSKLFSLMRNEKPIDYIGVDILKYDNWQHIENDHVKCIHAQLPNQEILDELQSRNLIFSQSSLEHIKNAEQILLWLSEQLPKAKHFHLVPAAASGFNYLAHGHRRYTLLDLVRIGEQTGRDYKITPIGGRDCCNEYFKFYTATTGLRHRFDFKKMWQEPYEPTKNLENICRIGNNEYPIFYAFEIL